MDTSIARSDSLSGDQIQRLSRVAVRVDMVQDFDRRLQDSGGNLASLATATGESFSTVAGRAVMFGSVEPTDLRVQPYAAAIEGSSHRAVRPEGMLATGASIDTRPADPKTLGRSTSALLEGAEGLVQRDDADWKVVHALRAARLAVDRSTGDRAMPDEFRGISGRVAPVVEEAGRIYERHGKTDSAVTAYAHTAALVEMNRDRMQERHNERANPPIRDDNR